MEKATSILRKSIFTFLQNYNHFTSKAALLALPFSASLLVSQALLLDSSPPLSSSTLSLIFEAAGLPRWSAVLSRKLSQTISLSILTLPLALSFLLACKAYVIRSLTSAPASLSSLLRTYLCNALILVSANATAFVIFLFAGSSLNGLGLLLGFLVYSVVLGNALVVCNLALVVSGVENSVGGLLATLKACELIKGRTSTALSLAIPLNLGLASLEALFQYRVVRAYRDQGKLAASMALEGVLISQLYSVLLVLDTVVNVVFFKTCKQGLMDQQLENASSSSCSLQFKRLEEIA